MKQFIVLFAFLLGIAAMPLAALDVPPLKGHVNDYGGMFNTATVQVLDQMLADFEKRESTQIVVLTIPSLKGEVLEEYSIKVAEKWKIGQKKLDNGVIILLPKQERKIRIEVGYGLEGRLTDALAGRIIDNDMKPLFKQGKFDEGIIAGVRSIIQAVKGEYSGAASVQEPKKSLWDTQWFPPLIIIGGMIFGIGGIILIMIAFAKRGYGGGGGSSSYGTSSDSYSSSSSDSSSSSSSSSGGDYSGGGGDFGGGGSSGDY